jgi:dihydrofolate reductase
MSKVVANTNVTLDGVMQAPAGRDEDPRGGFEHGGWATPYFDQVMAEQAGQGIAQGGAFLFGRRTYEHFASVWPHQPDEDMFANVLNGRTKYVASRTLEEPLAWEHSTLLQGDAADAVAELKQQEDKELVILGSGELIRSLMPRGLIDEYRLLIHPLVLGSGRRLFTEDGTFATLRLVDTTTTTTGVVIATYVPGEPPAPQPA